MGAVAWFGGDLNSHGLKSPIHTLCRGWVGRMQKGLFFMGDGSLRRAMQSAANVSQ